MAIYLYYIYIKLTTKEFNHIKNTLKPQIKDDSKKEHSAKRVKDKRAKNAERSLSAAGTDMSS